MDFDAHDESLQVHMWINIPIPLLMCLSNLLLPLSLVNRQNVLSAQSCLDKARMPVENLLHALIVSDSC